MAFNDSITIDQLPNLLNYLFKGIYQHTSSLQPNVISVTSQTGENVGFFFSFPCIPLSPVMHLSAAIPGG